MATLQHGHDTHSDTTARDPFGAGPYPWIEYALSERAYGLLRYRALLAVLVSWVPLALLTAVEGRAITPDPHESFLLDLAAYARYLLAPPLLIWAGHVCPEQLADIIRYIRAAELIAPGDVARYDALVDSTRRLLKSRWTTIGLLVIAYGATFLLSSVLYPADVSTWVSPASASGQGRLTLAGWWRMLVSQPLFLGLGAGWLWRLLLWARFLWAVSRMNLQLIAGHPDRMGGLRVVTTCLKGFSILALAIGVIPASLVGDGVLTDGRALADFRFLVGVHVAVVLVILAGPLMLLARPLFALHQRGTIQYGWLASEVGRQFEARWIAPSEPIDTRTLDVPDFSTTTDLFSVVANVQAINFFVLDPRMLIRLMIATLAPYVPVVLAVMPLDEIGRLVLNALT